MCVVPFKTCSLTLLINSLTGLDHHLRKRNDAYNKPQILISHLIAFHVALRVSSYCSITLKWMSSKGWHIICVGGFLFTSLLLSCLIVQL